MTTSTEPAKTYVVIGRNHWGRGENANAAKLEFRRHGGTLGYGYTLLTFGPELTFTGVGFMGDAFWTGEGEPEIKNFFPRKARA